MAVGNQTNITPPRVSLIDERTGAVSREWYRWFYSLFTTLGSGTGIVPVDAGGTGLGTIPTNGQLLIGNGTGYSLNTLGTGVGILVTNGLGTITVANTGVLSNIAGAGISVSSATGNVTIANTGVLSWSGGSTGLTPATATTGAVTLAGTLVIANGGTNGAATPTAGAVAYGTGTAYGFTAAGTAGQVLTSAGAGVPTWTTNVGGDVTGPASSTDNAIARFDGTTGKLIQNSVTTIDDTGNASGILSQQFSNGSAVTLAAGKMWYDGSTGAWNLGMGNGNITQQVGEEIFVYGKASAAITDSPLQIVYHTGTVGASGVITFAPTIAGITDVNAIVGIATENLALNGFGRATVFGVVRGITTNGTAFGETWADDDVIWYNPVTGNPTKVEPVAPYIKVQVGLVIKAGAGGSGSFQVGIARGSKLGGTDSNVQFGTLANKDLVAYNSTLGYWTNSSFSTLGLGSVTTVGFTGGLITVATATTTPALTVAGTSGGIVYFSSASTWASSAALAANALVIGGGAGVAPSTTTTGTGVVTALGTNVGTVGSFVTNGGALGTPSSGTVTNLTGTASININGTVGATTPASGAFTSVSDSGNLTFTGTGTRITGLMDGATIANILAFQTSTANTGTRLSILTNGTGTASSLDIYGASDPTNTSSLRLRTSGTDASIRSDITGTGTYQPMTFYAGGSERVRIIGGTGSDVGNVGVGTTTPSASALLDVQSTTKGVRMPNMTTVQKNAISSPAAGLMVFDTTLAKLCVYSGAAWQTITSI